MRFYRVQAERDGAQIYKQNDRGAMIPTGYSLIAGELFTARECERLGVHPYSLEAVEVSKRATFWSFGARFAAEGAEVRPSEAPNVSDWEEVSGRNGYDFRRRISNGRGDWQARTDGGDWFGITYAQATGREPLGIAEHLGARLLPRR